MFKQGSQSSPGTGPPPRKTVGEGRHEGLVRRGLTLGVSAGTLAATAGTALAAQPGDAGGRGLVMSVIGVGLSALVIGLVYYFSWRRTSTSASTSTYDVGNGTGTETGAGAGGGGTPADAVNREFRAGHIYESAVSTAVADVEEEDGGDFDPVGTGLLLIGYFLVISLLWLFMYFVEFLGNGPTVVG
jgi:hypothetical protein